MVWTTSYYHYDAVGSTRMLTGADQSIQASYRHEAFGQPLISNTTANPFRFVGQLGYYHDAATGLVNVRQRVYDANTARWLSQDPAESDHNLFRYAANNPLRNTDPTGLFDIDFHFYVTFYLLRSRGWSYHNAYEAAYWTQYVDEVSDTNPLLNFLAPDKQTEFHFYGATVDTPVKRNPPELRELLGLRFSEFFTNRAVVRSMFDGDGADVRLGAALHSFEDTWAHEGFTPYENPLINEREGGWVQLGHADAPEGGHAPDHPHNNPQKALEAALVVRSLIPSGENQQILRSTVAKDLLKVFVPYSSSEKRIEKMQLLIRMRFGEEVTYVRSAASAAQQQYFRASIPTPYGRFRLAYPYETMTVSSDRSAPVESRFEQETSDNVNSGIRESGQAIVPSVPPTIDQLFECGR